MQVNFAVPNSTLVNLIAGKTFYVTIRYTTKPVGGGGVEYVGAITPLSVARHYLAGATVGNYALFAGGYDSSYSAFVDAYTVN